MTSQVFRNILQKMDTKIDTATETLNMLNTRQIFLMDTHQLKNEIFMSIKKSC